MKKITKKKIEQDNSPFVEIINKENVAYNIFHFHYKFESEFLMIISFFISEMNSKILGIYSEVSKIYTYIFLNLFILSGRIL